MCRTVVLCIVALVVLSAAQPPAPKVNIAVPSAFRNQPDGAADTVGDAWWRGFGDPLLDELIERGRRTNLDILKAATRLAESDAMRKGTRSALLPDVSAGASVDDMRGGFNQGVIKVPSSGATGAADFVTPFDTSIVSGEFNMRWEMDVFGGLRKTLAAASGDARAAAENLQDVQVMVCAEIARNYVELRAAEEQIAIVRATIASESDLLGLIRSRADAGLASDLDVERQVAQLASVQAAVPELDGQRLQAIHRIGVLLGEQPAALTEQLQGQHRQLQLPAVPRAVPAEVLKRRPDIRRAEAQIAAAYARAGAARADLYPKLVITGLSGRQSTDLSGLTLGAGNFFSFGPGISLPIFNFGRIRSQIAARDAQLERALRSYEQDVLAAFEETENAFVARDRAEARSRDLEAGLAAAKRSVDLVRELYVRGLSDFLTVLDAQRQQFVIQRELAASHAAALRSTVALFKALGG